MFDYAELVKALRDPVRPCNAWDAADAIEELLDELTTIRKQLPRWISVEERLPEENKNYLTYGVFLPLGVKAMDMNRFDGTKWLTSADVEITHWMPLPAPPKEET